MPNGNINSDALDSLFDPKGNVVLEQFEDSAYGTTAVLLRPESAAYRAQTGLGDPYVVAYGYDKETGEWSHGYYTSNLSYAVDRANPEILEEATIKWQREDFELAAKCKDGKIGRPSGATRPSRMQYETATLSVIRSSPSTE